MTIKRDDDWKGAEVIAQRLFEGTRRTGMNEHEMLNVILATAISHVQLIGDDAKAKAEDAAKAFKAGLAAFSEASENKNIATPLFKVDVLTFSPVGSPDSTRFSVTRLIDASLTSESPAMTVTVPHKLRPRERQILADFLVRAAEQTLLD